MNKLREFLEEFGSSIRRTAKAEDVTNAAPRELHLELSYRCNTSCIMCNLRHLEMKEPELSLDDIRNFVTGSQLLNDLRFIVLSGGEAMLRQDFTEIVRFFRERYPSTEVLILSNLIDTELVDATIGKLKSSIGLEHLCLGSSLDGIGEAHDRIRGRSGSYESLVRSMRLLRQKYPALYFSLNFTLTPENCDQILPTFAMCRENNYHISYQSLVQKKETRQFSWTPDQLAVVEAQIDGLLEELARSSGITTDSGWELLANEGLLSLMLSIHYIDRYLKNPERYFPSCPCGEKFAMLDPMGNLYFCPVHKTMYAGNVRTAGFDAAWRSKAAEEARAFFNRRACNCWLTCTNGYMLGCAIGQGKQQFIAQHFNGK